MPTKASRSRQPAPASKAYLTLTDRELSELALARDEAAAWALTERVEDVIKRVVSQELRNQPCPPCLDEEDLVSYAKKEVFISMQRWKAGDGSTFHLRSYATTVARREVQSRLAANATIPVDHKTRRKALEFGKQARQFAEQRGRDPEPRELAAIVGKTVREVQKGMDWLKPTASMDQICGSEGDGENRGRSYEPTTKPEEAPDAVYMTKDLWEVARKELLELPPRQQIMLTGLFGMDDQTPMSAKDLRLVLRISQHQFKKEYWLAIAVLRARLK